MHRHLLIVGAAAAALSIAACDRSANKTEGAATPAEQAATPDANPAATIPTPADEAAAPDFVSKAGASDMFEIEVARLALKRSTNAEVKKFAQTMIDAHTKSTADLKKAITDSGQALTPPTVLPADLRDKVNDLTDDAAADFDKNYMNNQVDAHQTALNLMQRYAQDGDVPAIQAFAAATAPVVQQHYDMAKSLRDSLK
jgi:putative membrane protein